jgi:hypothetical protein
MREMEKIKQQVLNAVFHSTLIPLMYRETGRSTAAVAKFIVLENGLWLLLLEEILSCRKIEEKQGLWKWIWIRSTDH